jgi:hypothetical protein
MFGSSRLWALALAGTMLTTTVATGASDASNLVDRARITVGAEAGLDVVTLGSTGEVATTSAAGAGIVTRHAVTDTEADGLRSALSSLR